MRINDAEFFPGMSGTLQLPVGALPSGTKINVNAKVFRAEEPGPTVLFLAGIHGDEINGIEIVRRCIAENVFDRLIAGTVIAIPLLNVYGFINFSRDVPDGKDVNRAFPGSAGGSLASRIAQTLTKSVIPYLDFGIDFHTGGRGTYNYPQLRYTPDDKEAYEIGKAFGPPLLIASKPPVRSLRRSAYAAEVPILTYEGGENQRYDGLSIQLGTEGIKRLLVHHGMLPQSEAPRPAGPIRQVERSKWQRAGRAGLFRWYKPSGHYVNKGEPIGVICDPRGILTDKRVKAIRSGYIIGHANSAVVSQGDALFHIGE
ncbi:succinylglutamate desuccinylase [Lewinellaceae bacterium SD302]|nr:succinylglutamate desuccinylase [Lewinellaceae bacterium SD302]